mmetsp:Transcript_32446/g.69502  ORF Transcript_32446/g.69502 Transcript_32446/m.69502 type:complete len:459 (-) Transcript_32446:3500-4876(-)
MRCWQLAERTTHRCRQVPHITSTPTTSSSSSSSSAESARPSLLQAAAHGQSRERVECGRLGLAGPGGGRRRDFGGIEGILSRGVGGGSSSGWCCWWYWRRRRLLLGEEVSGAGPGDCDLGGFDVDPVCHLICQGVEVESATAAPVRAPAAENDILTLGLEIVLSSLLLPFCSELAAEPRPPSMALPHRATAYLELTAERKPMPQQALKHYTRRQNWAMMRRRLRLALLPVVFMPTGPGRRRPLLPGLLAPLVLAIGGGPPLRFRICLPVLFLVEGGHDLFHHATCQLDRVGGSIEVYGALINLNPDTSVLGDGFDLASPTADDESNHVGVDFHGVEACLIVQGAWELRPASSDIFVTVDLREVEERLQTAHPRADRLLRELDLGIRAFQCNGTKAVFSRCFAEGDGHVVSLTKRFDEAPPTPNDVANDILVEKKAHRVFFVVLDTGGEVLDRSLKGML